MNTIETSAGLCRVWPQATELPALSRFPELLFPHLKNESNAFTEHLYYLNRHLKQTRNSITIHIYNELTMPCSMGLSSAGAHRLTGLWRSKKKTRDWPKNLKLVSYLYMPFFIGYEVPNTNQIALPLWVRSS